MPPKKKLPEVKAPEGTIRVPAIIELSSSDSAAQFGKIMEKLDLIQAGQKDLATRVRKIEDSFPVLQFTQQLLSGRFEKIEKALPVMQKNQSDLLAQVEKIGKTLSPNDPSDPSALDNGNLFELFKSVRDVKSLINHSESTFRERSMLSPAMRRISGSAQSGSSRRFPSANLARLTSMESWRESNGILGTTISKSRNCFTSSRADRKMPCRV